MAALSNYAEKLLLDWVFTTGAATRPTTWFVALYTAAPSDSGGGTEVSTGAYVRKSISFSAAVSPGGTISNSNEVTFTASGAGFGTVTHIGIFDSVTSGNLLVHGQMSVSKNVLDGETLKFGINNLTLTLS